MPLDSQQLVVISLAKNPTKQIKRKRPRRSKTYETLKNMRRANVFGVYIFVLLCEPTQAGQRNNCETTDKMQRVDLFLLPREMGAL